MTQTTDQVYTVTYRFRIFDEEALKDALEDLRFGGVFGDGESHEDNTIEENLDILLGHLDVLADVREIANVAFYDVGIERVK